MDEAFHLLGTPEGDDFGACRDKAILEVFYGGGLRLSEVAGLSLADLDLGQGVLRVWGKGAKSAWPFWEAGQGGAIVLSAPAPGLLAGAGPAAKPPCLSIPGGGRLSTRGVARVVAKWVRLAGLSRA